MSREKKVILGLLRKYLRNDCLEEVEAPDWHEIDKFSRSNDIVPLLYHAVKDLNHMIKVPSEIFCDWKQCYYDIARRNLIILSELKKIITGLSAKGITVLPVKGACLAPSVYENIALRPMHDADILVRESDIPEVSSTLEKSGFTSWGSEEERSRHRRLGRLVFQKEMLGERIFLEIHRRLLWSSLSLPIEEFWEGCGAISLQGFRAPVPEKHRHFLYLMAHWSNHLRERSSLIWLFDQAIFIEKMGLDWDLIAEMCERLRLESALYHSLCMIKECFEVNIPGSLLRSLMPGWRKGVYNILKRHRVILSLSLNRPENIIFPDDRLLSELYPEEISGRNMGRARLIYYRDAFLKALRVIGRRAKD